jgi:signal transduction histidine kinase
VVLAIVATALAGWRVPAPVLRAVWIGAPALGLALFGTWAFVFTGTQDQIVGVWVWRFEVILICYLVLILRPGWAVAAVAATALAPSASALLAWGDVPAVIAGQSATHLGNVAYVVIFAAIRARLGVLAETERAARRSQAAEVTARATAQRRAEYARTVHDEVLSVLTAAMRFDGTPPRVLRHEATHAVAVIESAAPAVPTGTVPVADAVTGLRQVLQGVDPGTEVAVRWHAGDLQAEPLDVVTLAAAEAVRNSARHAGSAPRWVEIDAGPDLLRVAVHDGGHGFRPERAPADRLGVRQSIVGRMAALPGGRCVIDSGRTGTRVELSWHG